MINFLIVLCFALFVNVCCSFVMLAKFQNEEEGMLELQHLFYTVAVGTLFGLPIMMVLLVSGLLSFFERK